MMRQLTALAVVGFLGVALAGNAEACHKKKCGGGCGTTTACVPVVTCPQPVACAAPVNSGCGHRARKCGGGGLFAGCHKKKACAPAPCAAPVAYAYNYTTVAPSGQYMGTPQATGQMVSPPVPSKR